MPSLTGQMRGFVLLLVMAVLGLCLWLLLHAGEQQVGAAKGAVRDRATNSKTIVPAPTREKADKDAESRQELAEQQPEPVVLDVDHTSLPVAVDVDRLGGLPPDPIGIGSCALVLHLLDRRTRRRVASEVTLWRLDAPASVNWTRGDQPQYQVNVPLRGVRFEHLVPGRYRAVCHAERADAPDPPSFRVDGSETRVTLELSLPEMRHAWLVLYDEDGSLVEEAEMRMGARTSRPRLVGTRDWVKRRKLVGATPKSAGNRRHGGGSQADFTQHSWVRVRAGARGFDLGSYPGDPRQVTVRQAIEFRVGDGRRATIEVHGAHHGERVYYSVMPRRGPVLDALKLPDGRNGHAIAKEVTVIGRELLAGRATTEKPWRQLPIYVLVHHADYQKLSFVFRLGDGPLATRYVKAKAR